MPTDCCDENVHYCGCYTIYLTHSQRKMGSIRHAFFKPYLTVQSRCCFNVIKCRGFLILVQLRKCSRETMFVSDSGYFQTSCPAQRISVHVGGLTFYFNTFSRTDCCFSSKIGNQINLAVLLNNG